MGFALGIVCALCEGYAPLGTAACSSCGESLALEREVHRHTVPPESVVRDEEAPAAVPSLRHPPAAARPMTSPGMPGLSPRVRDDGRSQPAPPEDSSLFTEPLLLRKGSSPSLRTATPREIEKVHAPSSRSSLRPTPSRFPPPRLSAEELMEQAKNFVCRSCSTAVPMGHKFCGRCGAAVPPEILEARIDYYGQLQVPGRAKLILIRGEGVEGLSYQLNAEHHIVGRDGQLVFPDDPFVSVKHADFFYRNERLVVRDEGSKNGVYVRVRGSVDIAPGETFLAGEQLFRLDATPPHHDDPGPDGTLFYSSPKHVSAFRIVQLLQGGDTGITVCARNPTLHIGREGGEINFPSDLYMSAKHCTVSTQGGRFLLSDLDSRNGTYLRVKNEQELSHGDYVFVGRKLLRVEINAA